MIDPIGEVVVADVHSDRPDGRTWIVRWGDGDSTEMTEDEAGRFANGLRALEELVQAKAELAVAEWEAQRGIDTAYRLGYDRARAAAMEEARRIAQKRTECSCWDCSDECHRRREGAARVCDDLAGAATLPPSLVVVERETLEKVKAAITGELREPDEFRAQLRAALALLEQKPVLP